MSPKIRITAGERGEIILAEVEIEDPKEVLDLAGDAAELEVTHSLQFASDPEYRYPDGMKRLHDLQKLAKAFHEASANLKK